MVTHPLKTIISKTPARLDFLQSTSGFLLGLFLWVHLLLVSSILLGKEAMAFVARIMEGAFLSPSGEGYPILVSIVAIGIFFLVALHALLALRKMPGNWQQYRALRKQLGLIKHQDTFHWVVQAVTGFAVMFLVPIHLFTMFSLPETIGPDLSSQRIVAGDFWILYLPLLLVAELHATIGMYRLAIKWNLFPSKDPKKTRATLKKLKLILSAFFIIVGLITLAAYVRIGLAQG
jgi:fumarate reductase subunit C